MTEPSQYFKGRTVQEQMDEVIGYVDVRSAEVATTAIASDVAQVHQDMLDADADASAAAASAAAAAGTLANAVKKTGESSQSIAGDIAVAGTLSGGVVTGTVITAPAPVNNTDAANKKYVDDQDALDVKITDINRYAVGLTDNQANIAGIKGFVSILASTAGGRVTDSTECLDIIKLPLYANSTYNVSGIFASRHDIGLAKVGITTDVSGNVTSVTVTSVNTSVTRNYKIGARAEDNKLVISMTGILSNVNLSAMILTSSYSTGVILDPDFVNLPVVKTIANLTGYVQES